MSSLPFPGGTSTDFSSPLVSIVIVNADGSAVLDECLRSVFAQPYKRIEVIVVDNGSTDGSPEWVSIHFPQVRLIRNRTNRGFASANNQGVAGARGSYIVLLNNDTVVTDTWLPGLLEMITRSGVGVATSKVVTDGVPERFYEMNGTVNYIGYNIMRVFDDLSQVFFAGGASMIFRKEEIPSPFPDEFFLYHEDVYLSWLMRMQNRDVRMAQRSIVYHRGSATARRQASSLVTFYQERNRLLNCLFFYEMRTLTRLIPYFLFDAVAKTLLSAVGGRKSFSGILRSYWWLAAHWRWVRSERHRHQSLRQVPDAKILAAMSANIVDSESTAARLLNSLSRGYARCAGLAYHD